MQPTVLITSENFGRFSQEGRHVLEEAGLRIIDNPYGPVSYTHLTLPTILLV